MSWENVTALFAAMVVLASIPSVSVLAVVGRSTAFGVGHGLLTAAGIVAGDLVLMMVAILGLAAVAESLGGWFVFIQYAGAAYLIWSGVRLWMARGGAGGAADPGRASAWASFAAGLAITLADQKAILFYLAFFPAFVDLQALRGTDVALIAAVTIVAVGGAKCVYAVLAEQLGTRVSGAAGRWVNRVAAVVMIVAGLGLALRA
ncbi:MAG: LysE family translocator [Verrucomicrobiota bacterium]